VPLVYSVYQALSVDLVPSELLVLLDGLDHLESLALLESQDHLEPLALLDNQALSV